MKRQGVDFSFSWIFAIIAGAAIIVSAIYITSQLVGSGRVQSDTLVAGELANLLNPIETNLEDNKYSVIDFSVETRLYNECSLQGPFGVQKLSTASKSAKGQWSSQSVRKSVYNKYIFSRGIEESKNEKLNIMINPVNYPFNIGDAMIIYSGNYCFVNSPGDIEELVNDLSVGGKQDIGINLTSQVTSCPLNYTKVCFNRIGCDINVDTNAATVTKSSKTSYYEGNSLMLAAIFSDNEIYECQLKRMMKRASELGAIYNKKSIYVEASGCSNNLAPDLQTFISSTNISTSRDFVRTVVPIAKDLERRNNELASCKIF